MNIKELIKKLQKIQSQFKDYPDVIIDADENGHYELEDVSIVIDDDGMVSVNLRSSNEI